MEKPETTAPKLHPLAHHIPGWVELLLSHPGLRQEYEEYLLTMLEVAREQQDSADDTATFMKGRGAIAVLKDQCRFIANWDIERKRRKEP